MAGKLPSAELNTSVPDIYSCKRLINYWCICRTYDVPVDRFGGGEASHLHRYHPKFSTGEPKTPGEYIFCFPPAKFYHFYGFSVHHYLQDGLWLQGINNLQLF